MPVCKAAAGNADEWAVSVDLPSQARRQELQMPCRWKNEGGASGLASRMVDGTPGVGALGEVPDSLSGNLLIQGPGF